MADLSRIVPKLDFRSQKCYPAVALVPGNDQYRKEAPVVEPVVEYLRTCLVSEWLRRNRYVGQQLAQGKTWPEILQSMDNVAEGVNTTNAALALAAELKVEMQLHYPKMLQIPLDLIITAEEILGSAMRPDTANNATNAIRRFGLAISETPYITSATYWALVASKHDINALWNQRPQQDSDTDFDSDTIRRKNTKWMARGHGEWRGFYLGNT